MKLICLGPGFVALALVAIPPYTKGVLSVVSFKAFSFHVARVGFLLNSNVGKGFAMLSLPGLEYIR